MNYSYKIVSILLCIALLSSSLLGCTAGSNATSAKDDTAAVTDAIIIAQPVSTESTEIPSTSGSTAITLSGTTAAISGSGAEEKDGVVTIIDGGTYLVTGEITDGRILVNAPDEEVTIVLNNASIRCSYGSPVYVYKSSRTTLYLTDGTVNTLTDGSVYRFDDSFSSATEDEPNACLYSKSDLVIAGTGSLVVNANYNNGITSKDTLTIDACSITVTAENNGMNGKDFCVIQNAVIQITSGGDAVRSTNDTDSTLGYVSITDSSLDLTAGEDGIQAETSLTIRGGTCSILTGGGSNGSTASGTSAKGLKGGAGVSLYDGTYMLDCYDDAIHSNADVLISGGTYTITTADDAIHGDENTAITGGTINITKSYEGIEGKAIDISGGTIHIVASDDGINAAGGADGSGFGPRQDSFGGSSDSYIHISGGVITVDASGDGVDANGNLIVSGGELYVSGPTDNGNGALDYNGTATITGGIVIAAGSSGMAQNFGTSSTQGSILLTFTSSSTETITLKDASGNILVSYRPSKSYNCVVISCPSIVTGNTYTVEACGQSSTITMNTLIYGNSTGMGGAPVGDGDWGKRPDGTTGATAPNPSNGSGFPGGMGNPGSMGPGGRS